MATTSLYSSTTQSTAGSRRGSRQMRHCSSSETLKQVLQNLTFALTSISTSARRRTSTGSACRRWNAMRWALLGPTPGRRPSSSIRSWTAPSYTTASLRRRRRGAAGRGAVSGLVVGGHQLDLEALPVLQVGGVVVGASRERVPIREQQGPPVLRSRRDE